MSNQGQGPPFNSPSGTRDILPPESQRWQYLIDKFDDLAAGSGYGLILTPLFEDIGVFVRGVGEHTDVVTKEMYDFADKGGRHLALRPEVTAQVCRAYIQHRPLLPWKVRYWGPQFRYERPQAGRYRQFYQLGTEALGSADPWLDVEMVALAWRFCQAIGLGSVMCSVNSLGDDQCRPAYREKLGTFMAKRATSLCPEHAERWHLNPLRVLDCKKKPCRESTQDAPWQVDHLCEPCDTHWNRVKEGLEALEVPFVVSPRLVRGLDYYTRTTFEFTADRLDAAQNAVGGGGRYDGLVEALGGPQTPGIGLSMGIDRLLLAAEAEEISLVNSRGLDAYVVDLVGGDQANRLTHLLRSRGLYVDRAFDQRSLKSQLRSADRSGARFVLIVGQSEMDSGTVSLRWLRGEHAQESVPLEGVAQRIIELCGGLRSS